MSEARKKDGCKKCMVAFMNESGNDFEAPQPILGLEELQYQYTYAEGSNYADNTQNIYVRKPTGANITLTFTDIESKLAAKMLGKKNKKGGTTTNIKDKPPRVAVLFQETYSDGNYENKVFYNVKFSMDENSAKTAGENIDFTPKTITGRALPFFNDTVDGDIDFTMDSADSEIDKNKLDKFFEKVRFLDEEVS